jgi:hypothetical protein
MLYTKDKYLSIHNNDKDISFKFITDHFFLELFSIFNIYFDKYSTLEQIPSEVATINTFQGLPDKVFLLNDKFIVILEFDSSGKKTDLSRFMLYAAQLSAKYSNLSGNKVFYPVKFFVAYPATVTVPPSVYTSEGDLLFSFTPILLGESLDSDAILAKESQNFAADPNYIPSQKDSILLTLSPLGGVKGDHEAFCRKVASLAGKLFNKPFQDKFLGLSASFLNKYLKLSELSSLLGLDGSEMQELADLFSNGRYSSLETLNDKLMTETAELKAAKEAAELRSKIEKMVFKLSRNTTNSAEIAQHTGLSIEEIEQILN